MADVHGRAIAIEADAFRKSIAAFIERFNQEWLIERLDHRTPAVARKALQAAP